jgi:hypothetical protein
MIAEQYKSAPFIKQGKQNSRIPKMLDGARGWLGFGLQCCCLFLQKPARNRIELG